MASVGFENGAGVNYTIVDATGDLKVNKAALTVNVGNAGVVYGTPFKRVGHDCGCTAPRRGLVNGAILVGRPCKIDDKKSLAYRRLASGFKAAVTIIDYDVKSAFDALNNYNVTIVDGKAKGTTKRIFAKAPDDDGLVGDLVSWLKGTKLTTRLR